MRLRSIVLRLVLTFIILLMLSSLRLDPTPRPLSRLAHVIMLPVVYPMETGGTTSP